MSKNLSRAVQPFVTSVVCGKDVVPRLSIVNVGRLIDQMVCPLCEKELFAKELHGSFSELRSNLTQHI